MANEDIRHALGWWIAAADLSAEQFKFVKLNSSGLVAKCDTLGEKSLGVLQNKPLINQSCEIVDVGGGGVTKVVASAAIAIMADVSTAADGRATTALTTHRRLGIALAAAAAAGEIIPVLLTQGGTA